MTQALNPAFLGETGSLALNELLPERPILIGEFSPAYEAYRQVTVADLFTDLCPKFPPALRGVLGVKSLALGRHLVHRLSLQKFHRCQVAQC